ncbi:hypothetical protein G0Q06_13610 [Puniceicoccales bacterium CK1056]|uniref:Uncharacterized protein n=2 Tax=Oceanipulchritudo coccoides TaxID=2706888 RepID=A0A6B2M545_9BACT|nr:hypothetical protein [Oceanipulchritudo coccoides]
MARAMLGQNVSAIQPDGTIDPVPGEASRQDEPGHVALALGEFYRATSDNQFDGSDLVDLTARCLTAQAFNDESYENGLGYAALGLLSFGPAKERNPVWERLLDPTRECLDRRLLSRTDYDSHFQAFNVAKAVTRFSMGLSKKDETGKIIDRFIERVQQTSSGGFIDDNPRVGIGGVFDLYGPMSLVFMRQALQLHANIHLRDRKLPSLRTVAEKYLRLLPDLVRSDGQGWIIGKSIGVYGQMHCISLILQALRDGWITSDKEGLYIDTLRRLFQYFFLTYLDQDQGFLVIRDGERDTRPEHTTRMANFDGVRYLSQWARLASAIGKPMEGAVTTRKAGGRYIMFDRGSKKEQGLFLYQNPESGLQLQLPLMGSGKSGTSDYLPFPHCPGIFDWPVNKYLPIMLPELTIDGKTFIPAFYGKRCVTGLGLRKSFYFRYEQPELITTDEEIVSGLGSVKVSWTFADDKITSEFLFTVKRQVQCEKFRYALAIGSPHSEKHAPMTFALGEEGLGCNVEKDDFQAVWQETEVVTNELGYRTYWGNIHYIQTLVRDHPLVMRPGQQYRLTLSFSPDVGMLDS